MVTVGEEVAFYPGDPGTTLLPKSDLPCWFQGLEVLIWLKKGAEGQCIEDAESKQQ